MTTDTTPAADPTRSPESASRRRFDPLCLSGLAVTLLAFAASAPEDPTDTSAAGLRAFLADDAGPWQVYAILMAVTAAVLVVFVAHLRSVLVAASGRGGAWIDAAFGAGILTAGWLLLSAGLTGLPAFAEVGELSDVTLVSYWGLGAAADMVGVAAFTVKGLCMAGVAVAVLRTGALAAWIGWLSLLLGLLTWAALVVPPLFYVGIFAFALWPLAVSVALLARGRRGSAHPAVS